MVAIAHFFDFIKQADNKSGNLWKAPSISARLMFYRENLVQSRFPREINSTSIFRSISGISNIDEWNQMSTHQLPWCSAPQNISSREFYTPLNFAAAPETQGLIGEFFYLQTHSLYFLESGLISRNRKPKVDLDHEMWSFLEYHPKFQKPIGTSILILA